MVGWRNPARYLAPLALAAAGTASYVIVHDAMKHKHAAPPALVAPRTTQTHSTRTSPNPKAKFYVVRPNDTLSKIAARTGVSLGTIEQLNPSIHPDALHPSQRLRLR